MTSGLVHIHLANEKGLPEEIDATRRGADQYELSSSPIAVMGLARGDIVRLTGSRGEWALVRSGGNVALQFFVPAPVGDEQEACARLVEAVGGLVDHRRTNMFVASLPRAAGHRRIQHLIRELSERCPAVRSSRPPSHA